MYNLPVSVLTLLTAVFCNFTLRTYFQPHSIFIIPPAAVITVELQWLEHLWDYENLFEAGVVRAIEGLPGCPRSGKKSGKKIFFQGQGIVREF